MLISLARLYVGPVKRSSRLRHDGGELKKGKPDATSSLDEIALARDAGSDVEPGIHVKDLTGDA